MRFAVRMTEMRKKISLGIVLAEFAFPASIIKTKVTSFLYEKLFVIESISKESYGPESSVKLLDFYDSIAGICQHAAWNHTDDCFVCSDKAG